MASAPPAVRRRLLVVGAGFLGLLAVAAGAEQWLEARDERQLAGLETFVSNGEASIRYRLEGAERTAAPVVFVNGMAGSLEQWSRLQADVAAFAPVLAYDRAGMGLSRGSQAHDGIGQADELASVLDGVGLKRPVVLVGYSTSASIARIFVSRHPERVAGLVLLEPDLPEIEGRIPGRHNPFRTYFKPLLQDTVTTLLGIRRLASNIAEWRGRFVLRTEHERKAHAVLLRFSHWWAVDREWMAVEAISRQVREGRTPGSIPLLIYTAALKDETSTGLLYLGLLRDLAGSAARGELRDLGHETPHGEILDDPRTRRIVGDGLRELTAQAH